MNVSFFVCSCVHSVCVSVFFALFCIVVICCLLSPSTKIGTPKEKKRSVRYVCVCCYCLIRPVESIRAIALLLRHFAVRKLKPRATECSHASTLTHLNVYAYVMIIWIFRLCVCRQWVQDLQSYLSVLLVYNRCSFRKVDKKQQQQQQQPLHCMNKITETVSALYAPFTLYAQLNFDSMHNKNAENFVRATYSPATYDNGHKCTHANTMFFFCSRDWFVVVVSVWTCTCFIGRSFILMVPMAHKKTPSTPYNWCDIITRALYSKPSQSWTHRENTRSHSASSNTLGEFALSKNSQSNTKLRLIKKKKRCESFESEIEDWDCVHRATNSERLNPIEMTVHNAQCARSRWLCSPLRVSWNQIPK